MQPIETVSDTALWIAACRAAESERPDGLLIDPLSGILAGEKGRAFLNSMPAPDLMAFGVSLRVRAMDSVIEELAGTGEIDAVVDVGAGLDTRPYRLALSPSLRWFELDLPHIIEYKNECLRLHQPNCPIERIPVDLNDAAARTSALQRAFRNSQCALVLTEGVLAYLSRESAAALMEEAAASAAAQWWTYDAVSKQAYSMMPGEIRQQMDRVRSENHVDHQDLLAMFRERGWQLASELPLSEAVVRFAEARAAAIRSSAAPEVAKPPEDFWRVYLLRRD